MRVVRALNADCDCAIADPPGLLAGLQGVLGGQPEAPLTTTHANLFSDAPVFVDSQHVEEMRQFIVAISRVTSTPEYLARSLAAAPPIAAVGQRSLGVFNGYDFHMTEAGPRLIEINTNAGGALLNAFARHLQPPECPGCMHAPGKHDDAAFEQSVLQTFRSEWNLARPGATLRSVAIVDTDPRSEYLYPEFVLFQGLFERAGIDARIVDPSSLAFTAGGLFADGRRIDLVYNRLTDFYLERPAHRVLKEAFLAGAVALTPHPRAHAVLASKRNLCLLSDPAFLETTGIDKKDISMLVRMIPRTTRVLGAAEDWWPRRKQLFFKPANGFGSRGAYRGDKITRRAFEEVLRGDYVAQELALPGERRRSHDAVLQTFKVDVRAFAYGDELMMLAARLYQGQTTNFRTPGGGFAPVLQMGPEPMHLTC